MKNNSSKSSLFTVGIVFILSALLMKRLFIKNINMDAILSFLAGFALIFIGFLILRVFLKNMK